MGFKTMMDNKEATAREQSATVTSFIETREWIEYDGEKFDVLKLQTGKPKVYDYRVTVGSERVSRRVVITRKKVRGVLTSTLFTVEPG